MKTSTKATRFLQSLAVPEGPQAGQQLRLAPFQRRFVQGAFDPAVDLAVLSVGRGNAKSAISAGLALGALVGTWDRQPRRDVIIAARTRNQARVAWNFAAAFCTSLPEDTQSQKIIYRNLEKFRGPGPPRTPRHAHRPGRTPSDPPVSWSPDG
jgi:phage terminase large subunit-like protein